MDDIPDAKGSSESYWPSNGMVNAILSLFPRPAADLTFSHPRAGEMMSGHGGVKFNQGMGD
jgi:hypothetical protein